MSVLRLPRKVVMRNKKIIGINELHNIPTPELRERVAELLEYRNREVLGFNDYFEELQRRMKVTITKADLLTALNELDQGDDDCSYHVVDANALLLYFFGDC